MFGNFLGSFKHNPFKQESEVIELDLENLIKIIEGNEADEIVPLFVQAFEHFCKYPNDYDGASGDEENGASKKYDIPSIVHDYLSIIGLDYDWTIMRLTDALHIAHMKALHFNSIQIAKRKIGLGFISPFRWIRRRIMFHTDKDFREAVLTVNFVKWYKRLLLEKLVIE